MKTKLLIIAVFVCLGINYTHSQTWVKGYNGSGNGDDQITDVYSDENGNVYVTGFSMGANSGYDIVTIKYNANGTTMWTQRYPGVGSGEDKAFGISMDDNNYIYVTGYVTTSANNREDMVLIKYNPFGDQIWAALFNSGSGYSDKAFRLAIHNSEGDNSSSAIYITGYSSTGSDYDYRTLKYLSDGTFDWSRNYNGGSNTNDQAWGIVVDETGFVVVTGCSQTSSNSPFDYYTIKYSSVGAVIWSRRYDGPANSNDRAFGLVVDALKNYTITGYSANNSSGNPSSYDIATIQYDKEGATSWTKIYNGPDDMEDRSFGIAIDASNNVYVVGTTERITTSKDFITIKYSSTGGQSWVATHNSDTNNSDIAYRVALSPNGSNIYIVGSSMSGQDESPAMLKYNSSGTLLQSVLYPLTGSATCLSVSNVNNLFVGGYNLVNSDNNVLNNDFITMEFEGGIISVIGISGNNNEIPSAFKLHQNYPNPFNPVTTVKIQMPNAGFVKLIVHDITGKEIASLVNQQLMAGTYEVTFDAGNLASGIYFYKLVVTDASASLNTSFTDTKKMVLVK